MKTKEQLLAVCRRMRACWEAMVFIDEHASLDAYTILENITEWQIWFLSRRLTKRGLVRLARRLGCPTRAFYYEYEEDRRVNPHNLDERERKRHLRAVFRHPSAFDLRGIQIVNECWRAWCRS